MISIVVCYRNEDLKEQLENNIKENIGCNFEFLSINNSLNPKGICSIYNELAKKSNGNYLCFIHEDVTINTKNWGQILINIASEKDIGIIGVAGSEQIDGRPYWHNKDLLHYNFIQKDKKGNLHHDFTCDERISKLENIKVAVLDGMFLFCRKEI